MMKRDHAEALAIFYEADQLMEQKQLAKQQARGPITHATEKGITWAWGPIMQDCHYCSYVAPLTLTLPIPFVFTNHTPEQVHAEAAQLPTRTRPDGRPERGIFMMKQDHMEALVMFY
jgi:hypothetical protein